MRMLSKQAGFQMKKKRSLMRGETQRNSPKLPEKKQLKCLGTKAYPNYNDLSISARVKADQMIMQRSGRRI